MGQKANILTLRKNKINLTSGENSKKFLYGYAFLIFFEKLLNKKHILVLDKILNIENNICNLNLDLYFKTNKSNTFFRKNFFLKKNLKKNPNLNYSKTFFKLFFTEFRLLKINFLNLKFKNCNLLLNKKLVIYFYKKIKKFLGILFARRLTFFIDFVKITSLFFQSKIFSGLYLSLLGQIFQILPKRKHTRFFSFIKFLFTILVNQNASIVGLKLLISGKIQGKTRANSLFIHSGSIPNQTISKNIEFSKTHIYTRYGAFGFKFWVNKKIY